MSVSLHSEISKQDSQLKIHAYKLKLFSTFVLVGGKGSRRHCKISPEMVSVVRLPN